MFGQGAFTVDDAAADVDELPEEERRKREEEGGGGGSEVTKERDINNNSLEYLLFAFSTENKTEKPWNEVYGKGSNYLI